MGNVQSLGCTYFYFVTKNLIKDWTAFVMNKPENVYALYKGEEFLDIGTYSQLATKWNMTKGTLYSIRSRTAGRIRNQQNALLLILME